MKHAWHGKHPARIGTLPVNLQLAQLRADIPEAFEMMAPFYTVLGQDYETLHPLGFSLLDDGPTYLIAAGSSRLGKTALIQNWLSQLNDRYPGDQIHFVLVNFHSPSMSAISGLLHSCDHIGLSTQLEPILGRLGEEVRRREAALQETFRKAPASFNIATFLNDFHKVIVVIDDYERFASQGYENERRRLAELVRSGGKLGFSFIAAGNRAELPRDYEDPFMQALRKNGCGLLLGSSDGLEDFNFAKRLPGQPDGGSHPGRGFLVKRGRAALFQAVQS
jgi:hypothetical protein